MVLEVKGKISERLYCDTCKRKTNQGFVEKYVDSGVDEENGISWNDEYYITICLGCDNIAFFREYGDSEMIAYYNGVDQIYYTNKYRYPEEPNVHEENILIVYSPKTFDKVPSLISDLYEDVVASFNSRRYQLCAVGLRMIVEGICKELGVTEGFTLDSSGNIKVNKSGDPIMRDNLEGKINGLQTLGVTVSKHSEILHQVRLLGNLSAHELKVPRRKTVELGLEIIENILHNIFDLEKYTLV